MAFYLLSYIVNGELLQEFAKYYPQSELIPTHLTVLLLKTRFHLVCWLLLLWLCYRILMYTIIYGLLVSESISVTGRRHLCTTKCFLATLVSGELVGLAGTMDLIGISPYRLFQPAGMSMLGPGFIGIAIALLARLNPIGVIFSALYCLTDYRLEQMPSSWWFAYPQNWPLLFKPWFYCRF